MKLYLSFLLLVLTIAPTMAQKEDKEAIKNMCGCFSITFDYAETFSPNPDYDFHKPYQASARAEWIFVDDEDKDRLIIQHLLVMRDTIVIKHWRQDWIFANYDLLQFKKNRHWKYKSLPKAEVKKQWTQKVYQVDDSPRYQGSATWIHADGKHYWENTTDSPLPRREYTKRDDYNVMVRTNRHQITDYGWVHEQDNKKILREDEMNELIAEEKGLNKYRRIDDKHCQAAIEWWEEKKDFWRLVRAEWDEVISKREDLTIVNSGDKTLWKELFSLEKDYYLIAKSDEEATREAISAVIDEFVQTGAQIDDIQTAQMKP